MITLVDVERLVVIVSVGPFPGQGTLNWYQGEGKLSADEHQSWLSASGCGLSVTAASSSSASLPIHERLHLEL